MIGNNSKNRTWLVILSISLVIFLVITVFYVVKIKDENLDDSSSLEGIIVRVDENGLFVSIPEKSGKTYSLVYVNFSYNGNVSFERGQKVKIWSEGFVSDIFPGYLRNVKDVKILSFEGEEEIPIAYLRYCYNSLDNIELYVKNLSLDGLSLEVKDKNEYPYENPTEYLLFKRDDKNMSDDSTKVIYFRSGGRLLEKT